ncbi:Ig-like domain-containing protein [Diaminobutyricimonas aerilata]|uniref:Ig-like domain-containing protein n=1 Tax=Diaminobutyricimonas aerilata TaxID=1162967 RepID=A0A2M9CII1_9MICO|nr:Ig-like domain-containing protein [Diaminobutyricimonas aerilata]PJJ71665.1 Ig-like domain-containing protein [Diaminobutyricimonas aerilata]
MSTSRRWIRSVLATGAVLTVVVAGVAVPAAAADTGTAAVVEYPAGGDDWPRPEAEYGAPAPEARRIEISPAARTIRVEPEFPEDWSLGIVCWLEDDATRTDLAHRNWAGIIWSEEPAERYFTVPEGVIQPDVAYTVTCQRGEVVIERIAWHLSGVEDGAADVALTLDPAKHVSDSSFRYFELAAYERRTLRTGDTVVIRGEPGTFHQPGPTPELRVAFGFDPELLADDARVSDDGSRVEFTVPEFPPSGATRASLRVTLVSEEAGSDTTPTRRWTTRWYSTPDIVAPDLGSSVRLALSRNRGVSFWPTTGTARVTVPGVLYPTGTMTVWVDDRAVREIEIGPTLGAVSFRLPKLAPGTYAIRVQYSGAPGVAGSISAPASLHIHV